MPITVGQCYTEVPVAMKGVRNSSQQATLKKIPVLGCK